MSTDMRARISGRTTEVLTQGDCETMFYVRDADTGTQVAIQGEDVVKVVVTNREETDIRCYYLEGSKKEPSIALQRRLCINTCGDVSEPHINADQYREDEKLIRGALAAFDLALTSPEKLAEFEKLEGPFNAMV